MTKATTREGQDIRHSFSWIVSRRARLEVRTDSLVCGDWTIPYADIDDAVLFTTRQMFVIPCYVLRVTAAGMTYQFGLNPSPFWTTALPFPAGRERMPLHFSAFSLALRVVLWGTVGYLIWGLRD